VMETTIASPKFVLKVGMIFLLAVSTVFAEENAMKVNDIAPGFDLVDQNGKQRRLADYRNRWVVLYFYPKNNTPGCTEEACQFRDDYFRLDKMGADVIGISIDNRASHEEFARKYSLPFPLLADTDGKVASQYGSFFSFGPLKFARRHTFIIDPDGRIARIYRKVSPATHSGEVIRDLSEIQKQYKLRHAS
jgi:peroxiredoxin Q/BCP